MSEEFKCKKCEDTGESWEINENEELEIHFCDCEIGAMYLEMAEEYDIMDVIPDDYFG